MLGASADCVPKALVPWAWEAGGAGRTADGRDTHARTSLSARVTAPHQREPRREHNAPSKPQCGSDFFNQAGRKRKAVNS